MVCVDTNHGWGYLSKSDIIGTSKYLDANGDINEGIVIILRQIDIAGLKLTNVRASITKNLEAPLLLGQSAIGKLGLIQLDLKLNTLTILNGKRNTYDFNSKNDKKVDEHITDTKGTDRTKYKIGQSYGGGIIFYIDNTGRHGLIVAPNDQSAGIQWSNGRRKKDLNEIAREIEDRQAGIIATLDTIIGSGNENTNRIVAIEGEGNYAAKVCFDLILNDYDDWYLPSKCELHQLYLTQKVVGKFPICYYWSSSEEGDGYFMAYREFFFGDDKENGLNSTGNKNISLSSVRAIRSF